MSAGRLDCAFAGRGRRRGFSEDLVVGRLDVILVVVFCPFVKQHVDQDDTLEQEVEGDRHSEEVVKESQSGETNPVDQPVSVICLKKIAW